MPSPGKMTVAFFLTLLATATGAEQLDPVQGGVSPLGEIPSEQWIEKVVGDPSKPGEPFVFRIHHDAGYVVIPHTHPIDEYITVLKGSWALGIGRRVNLSNMTPMEQGSLGLVPKNMAHFGYAKEETIVQVHGVGPFANVLIDPVFELSAKGVLAKPSLLEPGVPTTEKVPDCFKLEIGSRVRGERGEGVVVGALCSPAIQFTEYWVKKANGARFWATLDNLKRL